MIHLGDITIIEQAPFVDCITFGSPCQDLSIAGKRAGLAGERSGLFMEAVRIIKEMRCKSGRTLSNFRCLGKCSRSFQQQRGRRFQNRAGRTWPDRRSRCLHSST